MKSKTIKTVCGLVIGALVLGGCSSDGSSSQKIVLTQGVEEEVLSGDKISPKDETTQIELRHLLDTDKKYVTLLAGSADLIRGNYSLE